MKNLIWVALVVILILGSCHFAMAQNNSTNATYVLTHLQNAAEAKDEESRGMGGVYCASPKPDTGNPASLALIDLGAWSNTYGQTRTSLFTVTGNRFRAYGKIGDVGIMVGSDSSNVNSFNLGGSTIYGNEKSTVLGFGLPIAKNLYCGVNFAPEVSTNYSIKTTTMIPPFPVASDVNISLRSGIVSGGSYGVLYSNKKFHAGIDFRKYREATWNDGVFTLPFGFGTVQQSSEESFDSTRYQIGIRIDDIIPKVDLVIGYYDSRFKSANPNGYEFNYTKMQYGANYKLSPNVHIQLGSNDGEFTAGVSFIRKFTAPDPDDTDKDKEIGDLSLQVSYARNQFKKLLESNPAITDKGHDSLNATVQWKF